ncbi:hypothetical protein ATY49_05025 [Xanthomonas oryzae pv. oryzae]|nr:hypothetical protein ATY49_05025 [Xanthomonas oryzae pv. oryzae]
MRQPIFRSNFFLSARGLLRPTWSRAITAHLGRNVGLLLGSEVLAKAAQQIRHLQKCAGCLFFQQIRFLLFKLFQFFHELGFGRGNGVEGEFGHEILSRLVDARL